MTIHIDDNTLRYKLQPSSSSAAAGGGDICLNALVGNTYLLYLFNPVGFRPLDWTYEAVVYVGAVRYALPVQREGVFLNTATSALRVFLSYGKLPPSGAGVYFISDVAMAFNTLSNGASACTATTCPTCPTGFTRILKDLNAGTLVAGRHTSIVACMRRVNNVATAKPLAALSRAIA